MYAIRQISTGEFLPDYRRSAGGTKAQPTPLRAPRLFMHRHHAQIALNWWLKGEREPQYDDTTGEYYGLKTLADTARDPADMRIVEVRLTVVA